MAAVIKKFGVMGFLAATVKAPSKRPGEGDEAYTVRVRAFLNEQAAEVDKGLAKGYAVGVKDQHEFTLHQTVANASGVSEITRLNSERKMAGLKQDPLMLGRNYSTTETIGRVIIAKLSKQVSNYQETVAGFLSDLFYMELRLQGFNVNSVEVLFKAPTLTEALKDEQAYQAKIKNANDLYNAGVISQEQRAQLLGYEEPDMPEPRFGMEGLPDDNLDGEPDGDGGKKTDPANEGSKGKAENVKITGHTINALAVSLGAGTPEFDYGPCDECDAGHSHTHNLEWNFPDPKTDSMFQQYVSDTKGSYKKAVTRTASQVGRELAKFGAGAGLQQVTDAIIYHLYKNWKSNFSAPQQKVIKQWVREMYGEFRRDKSFFGKVNPKNIPDAVFGLSDHRTMDYMRRSDDLYMGRFISDKDTRVRMTSWIKEQYINKALPLGNNKEALDSFKESFGKLFEGEEYKIVRIVATTTNKLRNYAAVTAMSSADVDRFVIRGVNDRLQCRYCSALQGKSFSVSLAKSKQDEIINSDPAYAPTDSPFLSKVFSGYSTEDIQAMSGDQIQHMAADLIPAHPLCRDVLVADI